MKPRDHLVHACRVPDAVPSRSLGPWILQHVDFGTATHFERAFIRHQLDGYESYTSLRRQTERAEYPEDYGEVVMEDSPRELRRHLPILLPARGRVLVSGLGLGCVLRGLLSKPEVAHVDVVEIDLNIVHLVWPEFSAEQRVDLHVGDAETITWTARDRWDFAWHDVWSETESLDVVHARLFARYADRCARQGAWQMPREVKRVWPQPLLNAPAWRRRAA